MQLRRRPLQQVHVERFDRAKAGVAGQPLGNPANGVNGNVGRALNLAPFAPRHGRQGVPHMRDSVHVPPMIAKMQSVPTAFLQPSVGYAYGMDDVRATVAANITTLQRYARDNRGLYVDDASVAAKAKLTPSTVGRVCKGQIATAIDTLDCIAKVYGLRAWQLLIPGLDPSNPPVVPYTDAERALYWRIKSVAADFARDGERDEQQERIEPERSGASAGDHRNQTMPRGIPAKRPSSKAK